LKSHRKDSLTYARPTPFHMVDITKSGYVDFLTPSITIGKIAGSTITNPIIFIGFDLSCGAFRQFS